jgi:hypothetical protein
VNAGREAMSLGYSDEIEHEENLSRNYFGRYSKRTLRRMLMMIGERLIEWIKKKHKTSYRKSSEKHKRIRGDNTTQFCPWQKGY